MKVYWCYKSKCEIKEKSILYLTNKFPNTDWELGFTVLFFRFLISDWEFKD